MIKVGITGGIGAGKTTIAKIFETKFNIPTYYASFSYKSTIRRILQTKQY
jgi:dephospho-CoA kinase